MIHRGLLSAKDGRDGEIKVCNYKGTFLYARKSDGKWFYQRMSKDPNIESDTDHNLLKNTHNLTTDIDHDALTNFLADEHIDWKDTSEDFKTSGYADVASLKIGSTEVISSGRVGTFLTGLKIYSNEAGKADWRLTLSAADADNMSIYAYDVGETALKKLRIGRNSDACIVIDAPNDRIGFGAAPGAFKVDITGSTGISGVEAFDANGYQKSGAKTRQLIPFGINATLGTASDWLHGIDNCDPGIFTVVRAGKLTGISVGLANACTIEDAVNESFTIDIEVHRSVNGAGFAEIGSLTVNDGDINAAVSNLDVAIAAEDRLQVYYHYSAYNPPDDVSLVKPQVLVEIET